MSDKCGNCDCSDKSQCVKKGSAYGIDIIETETSYIETVVMDAPAAAENCGKCKCGTSCTCTHCTCCSH
ncbi:metallothionein type 3 [Olea europaea subsp. europaea]|uniref:Metallothionein type 3 n=1 Tax=Olea europaea subsp. europaea TaxID=158383 RepID=A0A8S0QG35_OLEEU|nr:metallothionein type 3 [Olea europaea subsp. europaea]